jgi:hypothetical protein
MLVVPDPTLIADCIYNTISDACILERLSTNGISFAGSMANEVQAMGRFGELIGCGSRDQQL